MAIIRVITQEPAWPDLGQPGAQHRLIHLSDETVWEIAALEDGTVGGNPSIALRLNLPDGKVVVAETTWAAFHAAFSALRGRFGDPSVR